MSGISLSYRWRAPQGSAQEQGGMRLPVLSTMAWHRRTILDALQAQGSAMLETTDKNHLDRLRSRARRNGMRLSKSRRSIGLDNFGGLMLIDNRSNVVVAGSRYDLDLEDAADWIDAAGDCATE